VCVPDQPDTRYSDSAFLYIDGGHTKDPVPKSFNLVPEFVCFQSRTVGVALLQIPNQPIVYYKDGKGRSEDAMIGTAAAAARDTFQCQCARAMVNSRMCGTQRTRGGTS
jgi:PhoPQ-activated pathogenicity-related protein